MIAIKIVILFLFADLATGIFHFLVDQYGVMNGKVMTKSVNFLLLHHDDPQNIVTQTYWQLNGRVYIASFFIFGISLFFGFYWELLLFLLFCSNGNMIHKWSHFKKSKTPVIISQLQRLKIIQDHDHHIKHHNGLFNANYCVMSNILNPILERIYFWAFIIFFLKLLNIKPVRA